MKEESTMRISEIKRKTKETDISLTLNLDGTGTSRIDTGIPFLDHMLGSFSKHSGIDLEMKVKGDVEVDFHHTIEDSGIVLGEAIRKALGDKIGLARFSDATIPLDEALSRVSLDISGRAYLNFNVVFERPDDGNNVNPYLFEEFFRALVNSAQITLHIDSLKGKNSHHIVESVFKAFAKAIKKAVIIESDQIPSTKGKI
jgi:imidazoleglycerol-phosphate dehydratase